MSNALQPGIRFSVPADLPALNSLVRELARYERLLDSVVSTQEDLHTALFGDERLAEVLVAETDGIIVGFALYFKTYSTFQGRPGLYLEDLFVLPEHRGRGFGRKLLQSLRSLAAERGCSRLEWSVLDWNESAIRFYTMLGAQPMHEWTVYRINLP